MRKYLNGGYYTIDLSAVDYANIVSAATVGKPIMVKDGNNIYFIDTISLDDEDNIIITKGGKTITITSANVVSSEGEIQPQSSGSTTHYYKLTSSIDGKYEFVLVADKTITLENLTIGDLDKYLVRMYYYLTGEDTAEYSLNFIVVNTREYISYNYIEATENGVNILDDTISLAAIKQDYTLTELN